MSMLSKRLGKLELGNLGGLVIFIADEFTAGEDEPIIRHACLMARCRSGDRMSLRPAS